MNPRLNPPPQKAKQQSGTQSNRQRPDQHPELLRPGELLAPTLIQANLIRAPKTHVIAMDVTADAITPLKLTLFQREVEPTHHPCHFRPRRSSKPLVVHAQSMNSTQALTSQEKQSCVVVCRLAKGLSSFSGSVGRTEWAAV